LHYLITEVHNKFMTPEEKVDSEFWYVLKEIKTNLLRTKSSSPIDYWVYPDVIDATGNSPSTGDEIKILEKLEELGAIKILNPGGIGEYEV